VRHAGLNTVIAVELPSRHPVAGQLIALELRASDGSEPLVWATGARDGVCVSPSAFPRPVLVI